MRVMELPTLSVPATAADSVALYKQRFHSTDRSDLPLMASISMLSYIAWPNDEAAQKSWIAATIARQATLKGQVSIEALPMMDKLGGLAAIADVAFEKLNEDLTELMKGWPPVADVMSRLVDMAHDERAELRGGPSIAKAVAISDFEPEGKSRARIETLWSRFRDVAHLLAAGAFLADTGIHERARSIFSVVWFAPDAVASIAAGFEEFGLTTIPHGQKDSLLPSATTWRLPVSFRPQAAYRVPRRLSDEHLDFLKNRRSPKPYSAKPG